MDYTLILKILWASVSLSVLGAILIVLLRFRSVFGWKRALIADLNALGKKELSETSARRQGIEIIEQRCRKVFESSSPDIEELRDIPQYITAIAACYHPDTERPELHVRIGSVLQSLDISLNRFDSILKRPGFGRLQNLTIRNIRNSYRRYRRFTDSRWGGWYLKHRVNVHRFMLLRLFILPDPLSWVAYLSRHLTILLLTKYLMADLYLFFGRLALNAYDIEASSAPEDEKKVLEDSLEALENLEEKEETEIDPRLSEIRRRLVGFRSVLLSDPTYAEWKASVYEAAAIIAEKHFPESDAPLEEAAVRPLLERGRYWISAFIKGEEYPMLGKFYNIRLYRLYQAKNLTDMLLPASVRNALANAGRAYKWLKWPLRIYIWVRRISPWQIALDVGWSVGRKAGLSYLCGKTFDKACKELDNVYSESRKSEGFRKQKF